MDSQERERIFFRLRKMSLILLIFLKRQKNLMPLSVVLGIGLSWSLIRRHLTGQVDMDDVEE